MASKPPSLSFSRRITPGPGASALWDPTGTMPVVPGGTSYRDAAPAGKFPRQFDVAFKMRSANQEIIRERRQAVINAREADRNNTMVRAGITKRASDLVGKNLRLQSMPNFEALGLTSEWAERFANRFENLFSLWGDDPRKLNDAARHSSFGSQMFEVCRGTYGADGEAALIIRADFARMRKYRGRYATFVEVLDPDRICNPQGLTDSDTLCQGRVLDQYGAYEALHVARRHPSDPKGAAKWDLVPRETSRGRPVGVHWFPRYRAGAQRAMPAILGSLREVRMLDTVDQKLLEMAVKEAFMSIVIKTDKTTAEALASIQGAPTGNEAAAFAQGMDSRFALYEDFNAEGQAMPVMAPGDEVSVASPESVGTNWDSFRFAFERKFASFLGLSYARFSNDYSKTSFASIRAELIDAWRMTFADRYEFCGSVPSLVALAALEEFLVRGFFDDIMPPDAPYFYENMTEYAQCEWRGPGMGWVDPVKDAKGSNLRVAAGYSNPQAEAASQGSDYYDNIDQTARAQAYAKRKLGREIDYSADGAAVAEEPDPEDVEQDPNAPAPPPANEG